MESMKWIVRRIKDVGVENTSVIDKRYGIHKKVTLPIAWVIAPILRTYRPS